MWTAPKRAKVPRTPSVLIVQCDTNKLRASGLAGAGSLATATASLLDGVAPVDLVEATTSADLEAQLGARRKRLYTTVVVIGHSNEDVIRVGSDKTLYWPELPALLKGFKPRSIVIVGCKAGSNVNASQFFAQIPSVKDVYASPVNARAVMLRALAPLLPVLATATKKDDEAIALMRFGTFLATDEALFRYERKDWERWGEEHVAGVEMMDALTPGVVQWARNLKRGASK